MGLIWVTILLSAVCCYYSLELGGIFSRMLIWVTVLLSVMCSCCYFGLDAIFSMLMWITILLSVVFLQLFWTSPEN